jgi:hypothetical protein
MEAFNAQYPGGSVGVMMGVRGVMMGARITEVILV